MTTMIPKTLALDYGTVRVGVAVSRGTLADPLTIVPNDANLFSTLLAIIAEEEVAQIVVGVSENEMAQKSQTFAQELQQRVSLPVQCIDETLSSKSVHEKLQFAKKAVRRSAIDHFAAATFLQEWIDEHE